jgi:hypothetical protein
LPRAFLFEAKMNSGYCAICGMYRESLHRDHIIPKWAGGSHGPENIQYICANCHQDKTIEEIRSKEFRNRGIDRDPEKISKRRDIVIITKEREFTTADALKMTRKVKRELEEINLKRNLP